MNEFSYNLKELIDENHIDLKELSQEIGLADASVIYQWLAGTKFVRLSTAIKLANYFNCSLDFLFGRTDDNKNYNYYNNTTPFDRQFRTVLKNLNLSQYKLIKDNIVTRGNLNSWLNLKQTPNMKSIIKLADYLDVSIDYLVGRE